MLRSILHSRPPVVTIRSLPCSLYLCLIIVLLHNANIWPLVSNSLPQPTEEQVEQACLPAAWTFSDPAIRDALVAYAARYGLADACRILVNSNDFLFVN